MAQVYDDWMPVLGFCLLSPPQHSTFVLTLLKESPGIVWLLAQPVMGAKRKPLGTHTKFCLRYMCLLYGKTCADTTAKTGWQCTGHNTQRWTQHSGLPSVGLFYPFGSLPCQQVNIAIEIKDSSSQHLVAPPSRPCHCACTVYHAIDRQVIILLDSEWPQVCAVILASRTPPCLVTKHKESSLQNMRWFPEAGGLANIMCALGCGCTRGQWPPGRMSKPGLERHMLDWSSCTIWNTERPHVPAWQAGDPSFLRSLHLDDFLKQETLWGGGVLWMGHWMPLINSLGSKTKQGAVSWGWIDSK